MLNPAMRYEGSIAVAPPADKVVQRLDSAMLWVLAFFLFALPLVEAPKNIAAVAYLVLWCARAMRTRDLGGRWNRYDTAFAVMLASALASGLAGWVHDVTGVFRVYLLAWAVSRAPLPGRAQRPLMLSACIGLLLAIVIAAVPFLDGRKSFLELPSVGQVNQSALYIAIMTATAFGWWLQQVQAGTRGAMRTGLAVFAVVCCAALLAGGSRAAAGAVGVAAVLIGLPMLRTGNSEQRRRIVVRTLATVAVLGVLVAGLGALAPNLSDKKLTPDGLFKLASTETRIKHWRLAYEGWRERPWLGWGPESFQQLKVANVCRWRQEHGEDCNPDLYMPQVHAHSLYFATLAERGLVGVLALAFLLVTWGAALVRSARTAAQSWLWPASAAGLLIAAIAGTFNTTMRVEHGSLAALWFGLWIAVAARGRPPEA